MSKILNHIRKQPLNIRTRYMYGVVIACTAVVIILWIISLGYRFSNISLNEEVARQKNVINTFSETNTENQTNSQTTTTSETTATNEPFQSDDSGTVDPVLFTQ